MIRSVTVLALFCLATVCWAEGEEDFFNDVFIPAVNKFNTCVKDETLRGIVKDALARGTIKAAAPCEDGFGHFNLKDGSQIGLPC